MDDLERSLARHYARLDPGVGPVSLLDRLDLVSGRQRLAVVHRTTEGAVLEPVGSVPTHRLRPRPGARTVGVTGLALAAVFSLVAVGLAAFAPMSPSGPPFGPGAAPPNEVSGQPVLRGETLDAYLASGAVGPFLLGGWLAYDGSVDCRTAMPSPSSELESVAACGFGWEVEDSDALPTDGTSPRRTTVVLSSEVGDGLLSQAVVIRVHRQDPAAQACQADLRARCERVLVVDDVVWAGQLALQVANRSSAPAAIRVTGAAAADPNRSALDPSDLRLGPNSTMSLTIAVDPTWSVQVDGRTVYGSADAAGHAEPIVITIGPGGAVDARPLTP